MKNNSRLIIYLLINILISAVITLIVLWLWGRANPQPIVTDPLCIQADELSEPMVPLTPSLSANTHTSEPAIDFISNNFNVSIRIIVGAENLEVEYVEILNQSEGPVDLTGWQLIGEDSQTFTFPTLILNSGGAIKVHSKKGTNTVIELYWQADAPVWQSGETVHLINTAGEIIATYSIP